MCLFLYESLQNHEVDSGHSPITPVCNGLTAGLPPLHPSPRFSKVPVTGPGPRAPSPQLPTAIPGHPSPKARKTLESPCRTPVGWEPPSQLPKSSPTGGKLSCWVAEKEAWPFKSQVHGSWAGRLKRWFRICLLPVGFPPNLREIDTETPKSVPEGVKEGHPRSSPATTTRELNMGWGLRLLVYGPPHNPQLSVGGRGVSDSSQSLKWGGGACQNLPKTGS